MNVTAINVFIQVDGRETMAIIGAEQGELFVRALGAFQAAPTNDVTLYNLPPEVEKHVQNARLALFEHWNRIKAAKQPKRP